MYFDFPWNPKPQLFPDAFCKFVTLTKPTHNYYWVSTVRAFRPESTPPDGKLPKMSEMKALNGETSIFYTCLCKRAEKWLTLHWPELFYSQLQQPPCTVTQSDRPTSLCPRVSPFLLMQNRSSKQITCMSTDITCRWIWMMTMSLVVKGFQKFSDNTWAQWWN